MRAYLQMMWPVGRWVATTASAKNALPALMAAACAAGSAHAQTITSAPAPVAVAPTAALPVPLGQPLTWLLLGLALVASLAWLLKRMGVRPGHLRQRAIGAAVVALGASTFWGDAVRAQMQALQRAFTQTSGETLAIPLQTVETAGVVTGFVPVEFANTTSVALQIKDIAAPTEAACFPAGAPAAPVSTTFTPTSAPCASGLTLDAGQACWVNVAALCAAVVTNRTPVAVDDSAVLAYNTATSIAVLANDSDPDGDALQIRSYTAPTHGSLARDGADKLRYTPNANYQGADSFSYTISDGKGLTATAHVTITVNAPTNQAPVAVADSAQTSQDTPVTIAVRSNDFDADGDVLRVTGVTQGANGSVVIDTITGNPIYTPNTGFAGTDNFTYTVDDGKGATSTATVTITITVNAPLCGNGVVEAGEQCDDGNNSNNDSCLNSCQSARCGDGFLNSNAEQCDDGNAIDGDGCSSTCEVENKSTPISALGLGRTTARARITLP